MAENEKNIPIEEEDFTEDNTLTLINEETGEEEHLELRARTVIDGGLYFALTPTDEATEDIFILKAREDGEDILFETIEDDEEYYKAEDVFNDMFFGEVDYDKE